MNEIPGDHVASPRRTRFAASAGVLAFAVLVSGVAVLASHGGRSRTLPLLPAGRGQAATAEKGSSAMALAPAGPLTYDVKGTLPALADKAAAYRFAGPVNSSAVAKLAAALGMSGSPQQISGMWFVQDGSRSLTVIEDAAGSWHYSADQRCNLVSAVAGQPGGIVCSGSAGSGTGVVSGSAGSGTAVVSGSATASSGSATVSPGSATGTATCIAPVPAPPTNCSAPLACQPPCGKTIAPAPPADLPSQADAEKEGRDLLGRLGLDLNGASVKTVDAFSAWQVQVAPQVDGLPTQGYQWSVGIGPKGAITEASGWLVSPTRIGSYPLVGTPAALQRLRNGERFFGGVQTMMGAPMMGAARPAMACPAPTGVPSTSPALYFCQPQVVTITGVHLGLVMVQEPGQAVLEPAYMFETGPEGDVAIPAVPEGLLAPVTKPVVPGTRPGPSPGPPVPGPVQVEPAHVEPAQPAPGASGGQAPGQTPAQPPTAPAKP